MHHIYHTEAFVLKSVPIGEDSKTLFFYTKELGLIPARAQAIRKLSSKLRYILQDGSRVYVDLVRGKEIWRVTTAVPYAHEPELSTKALMILVRIHSLVVRLCAGEEQNEEVFSVLSRARTLLSGDHSKEEYRTIELLSVARILIALGYLEQGMFSEEDTSLVSGISKDIGYQHRLVRDINTALAASQL